MLTTLLALKTLGHLVYALINVCTCFNCGRRPKTPGEKLAENAAKRRRQAEDRDAARMAGWRPMNNKQECFIMTQPAYEDCFPMLVDVRSVPLVDVFLRFVNEELVQSVIEGFSDEDKTLSFRKTRGTYAVFHPTINMIYLVLAMHIRIIGNQVRSSENDPQVNPLRRSLDEGRAHFEAMFPGTKAPGIDICSRLTACINFIEDRERILAKNFQAQLLRLGAFVAGDEKLFHFTGVSGNVRLVISKPDKIGLWFYELCCTLKSGAPYLLDFKLHDNSKGPILVSDVVTRI